MMKEKTIGYIKDGVYVISEDIGNIANGTRWAEGIPVCAGGTFDGVYSGGDGSFIVCINDCNAQDLLDYAEIMEAAGYTRYSENKISENLFFTYQNGENYVWAYYIKNTRSIKIIAEPFYRYVDFTPERNLVTPAVIASSACDRTFYVRLPDNTLVVMDGGWRIEDWSREDHTDLLTQIYEEMRQILGGEEIINVSLWITTHAHTDHARVLETLHTLPLAKKFRIRQMLYNFPCNRHLIEGGEGTKEQLAEMRENLDRWHRDAGVEFPYERIFYNCPFRMYDTKKYENICREAFKQYGAVQIKAHDGMKLSLSGVLFEVIHTQDDDMPAMFDNNNNISIVVKMTYRGSTMLWLGDMCEIPSESCAKMYGEFLKSDCLQVSHHGWNAATPEFYEVVRPSVLFWGNSEFGFKYSDKKQGYGKTKISTDLYHMDCVKKNIFCNKIGMTYVELPVRVEEKTVGSADDCQIIASAVSDRIFFVRTPENKLIVIDGGWRKEFWEEFGRDCLIHRLYAEMARIVGTDTITVAAWFVTNSYQHNIRFLEEYPETDVADRVRVERIVCSFPEKECYENYDNGRMDSCLPARIFAKTGAEIVTAHSGDAYEIGAVKANILYAPEGERYASVADSSLVFKLIYADQSVIFTGDMTDRISRHLLDRCPEELSCEVVQVANHGWSNCGVLAFYEACGASVQLWNNSEYGYRFFRPNEGYRKTEVSTKVYGRVDWQKNIFCDCVSPVILGFPLKK